MCREIKSFRIKDFGLISDIKCEKTGKVNLIIGENSTGKSTILKAIYSMARTFEEYGKGDDKRNYKDILSENLRWTFQVDKLGELVRKGDKNTLQFGLGIEEQSISYSFGNTTATKVTQVDGEIKPYEGNSIFIPSREIFTIQNIILRSREIDRSFGFDNTYYDLAKVLRSISDTSNAVGYKNLKDKLNGIIGGSVEYDRTSDKWFYKKGNAKFSMNTTAEGIKKIAMLEKLLSAGILTSSSILFLDEPEASLHPSAIVEFLDCVYSLATEFGIQVFIASHSYFVLKKLRLLAMQNNEYMPCISLENNKSKITDLSIEMPENEIISESIKLYEAEMGCVLG